MLARAEIEKVLVQWQKAWNKHDLDGVMDLFHEEVLFENWTGGKVRGKEDLRQAWSTWFANHGGFQFSEEDTFIDETTQKVLFQWQLVWPSPQKGYEMGLERRRGVDILHFQDGKIIQKLTYSKTTIEIQGEMIKLSARTP